MEIIPCNEAVAGTPLCPVYERTGHCFMDVHHVYHLGETTLQKVFTELDENKRRNCRAYHQWDEAAHGWPEYPEVPVMIDAVARAIENGELHLSKAKSRKLGGLNGSL